MSLKEENIIRECEARLGLFNTNYSFWTEEKLNKLMDKLSDLNLSSLSEAQRKKIIGHILQTKDIIRAKMPVRSQ